MGDERDLFEAAAQMQVGIHRHAGGEILDQLPHRRHPRHPAGQENRVEGGPVQPRLFHDDLAQGLAPAEKMRAARLEILPSELQFDALSLVRVHQSRLATGGKLHLCNL